MGLRDTIQKAARTAVAATGDIAVSANYLAYSSATYNASTGSVAATYATVAGITVVFSGFRLSQIDGENIRPEDKKALIPALLVTGVTPKPDDQVVASGVAWTVINAGIDPADALHVLQVRRP